MKSTGGVLPLMEPLWTHRVTSSHPRALEHTPPLMAFLNARTAGAVWKKLKLSSPVDMVVAVAGAKISSWVSPSDPSPNFSKNQIVET